MVRAAGRVADGLICHPMTTTSYLENVIRPQLAQGLELVGRLSPGREQMRRELRLLLALGPPLSATRGFGAPEVGRTYRRASDLGETIGQPAELFQAMWGLWLFTTTGRGGYDAGRRIAEDLIALGERLDDPALRLEAHHAMSPTTLAVMHGSSFRGDGRSAIVGLRAAIDELLGGAR